MAVTSIWKIKKRLDHVIDYTTNEEKVKNINYGITNEEYYELHQLLDYVEDDFKTEKKCFVSALNCNIETAYEDMMRTKERFGKKDGILAYHAIQSFAENEVKADLAHKIGVKLAEELWGDRFEVIISTHLNTDNIHNHFCLNSVSFKDGKKYYDTHESYSIMRHTSDNLCKEFGISYIPEKKCKKSNINYENFYKKSLGRNNYQSMAKQDLDKAILQAYSYEDFKQLMSKMDYEVILRAGKISIRHKNYKRNIRIERSFGENYTVENIKRRIIEENETRIPFIEAYRIKKPKIFSNKKYKKVKAKGFKALYYHYCYILQKFPKRPNKKISVAMRADILKMEQISKEAIFLNEYSIDTEKDLVEYKAELQTTLQEALGERENLWRKRKNENDKEVGYSICNNISDLTHFINEIRGKLKMCENIEERIPKMKINIKELNEELKTRKEIDKNEHIR